MGPIAGKILRELRKASRRDVIDLDSVRRARSGGAPPGGADELAEGLAEEGVPAGYRFWMHAFGDLARFAFPLLGLRPLQRLAERIERSEERYRPGEPKSPLTDSFHTCWSLLDATTGVKRETLATIAIEVARANRAPGPLLNAWDAIARSYPGLYQVARRSGRLVTLEELVTGERFEVEMTDDVPGDEGTVWWTRLLPPQADEEAWTSITTPYVFHGRSAERDWREYFARQLEGVASERRGEAYRALMKHGEEPFAWFQFIFDASIGVSGCAIAMGGVPDRTESLPQKAPDSPGAEPTPLERVRQRLMEMVRARGLGEQAVEDFRSAREEIAGLPASDPPAWSSLEQTLLAAYAMYGATDEDGSTALDRLASAANGEIPGDERAQLEALEAGWFSVFEILRIKIDEGLEVRDVLRRRRFWIRERMATRGVSLGGLLAGWIMKEGDEVSLEGALAWVPPLAAGALIDTVRDAMADLRKERGLSWKERQNLMVPLVSALVARLERDPARPELVNHEGHPLLFSEATYRVCGDGVADSLKHAPELEADGVGAFVWMDAERDALVAHIEISGATLCVRTNSRERLERVRAWLEERLGEAIAHRADAFSDPNSEAYKGDPGPAPALDDVPAEVREAAGLKLRERLESWLDEPIPALGGKTPRQAVRSERGRDDVSAMLLEQERILRQGPLAEGIDFAALWSELGLEYPDTPTSGRRP